MIEKLYMNNNDFNFEETLKRYEHEYKLLDYERELLFILISLPFNFVSNLILTVV